MGVGPVGRVNILTRPLEQVSLSPHAVSRYIRYGPERRGMSSSLQTNKAGSGWGFFFGFPLAGA